MSAVRGRVTRGALCQIIVRRATPSGGPAATLGIPIGMGTVGPAGCPDQERDPMVPPTTSSPAAARRPSSGSARPNLDSLESNPQAAWRQTLAPYAKAHNGRALLGIATSVVPYLALSLAMYFALRVSDLLVLAVAIPAGVFLVRTFIVFHDCSHSSFLAARRANALLGP